jgi:hypothetical protein
VIGENVQVVSNDDDASDVADKIDDDDKPMEGNGASVMLFVSPTLMNGRSCSAPSADVPTATSYLVMGDAPLTVKFDHERDNRYRKDAAGDVERAGAREGVKTV